MEMQKCDRRKKKKEKKKHVDLSPVSFLKNIAKYMWTPLAYSTFPDASFSWVARQMQS